MTRGSERPLCVDLDGTLIRSDMLVESSLKLIKQNPLHIFLLPIWLMDGKANLKHEVASRVRIDVSILPYDMDFLDYLNAERADGRTLILATATNEIYARSIADHLGIFDDVFASDCTENLSGIRKRDKLVEAFGDGGFDYAGNDHIDVEVWKSANAAVLVGTSASIEADARSAANVEKVFSTARPSVRTWLRAIRIHQWLKNMLVFVPIFTAQAFFNINGLISCCFAFIAFSLCASSVYILNDLFDLNADRMHPTKRKRPLASGSIPLHQAVIATPLLLLGAFAIASFVNAEFMLVLSLYYIITLSYSLWLKRIVLIDVLVLAGLYTIRVIAGGVATSIEVSFWLLAFSTSLFLSLALVKRYAEILVAKIGEKKAVPGRGYETDDLETLSQFGICSGYLATLVLAFYINSDEVLLVYNASKALWLSCPIVLYCISRIWLLARRNEMHEDPVIFLIEDRHSHYAFLALAVILWIAT